MTESTYRSINSIKKLFVLLIENINVMKSDLPPYIVNRTVKESFVSFLTNISKDYCLNIDKFKISDSVEGGAGTVGKFMVDKQRIYVNDVSFPSFGSFTPFNAAVVIKRNLYPEELSLQVNRLKNDKVSLLTNTQFHEILVSSIMSYIYDLDICPHITKFYGCFLCDQEFTIIEEASDITFADFIGKYKNQLIYPDLQILLFQLLFTFMVEKRVCGAINYDLHMKNLMFQVMKDNVFNIKTSISDPIIQGVRANECQYYAYEFKIEDKYYEVVVENLGLLIKMIDVGNVYVDLDYSGIDPYYNLKYPIELVGNLMRIPRFNEIHFERYKFFDTHEFCFTLINLVLNFDVILDKFNIVEEGLVVDDQEKINNYNRDNPIINKLNDFILFINKKFGGEDSNIFSSEMNLEEIREYIYHDPERWLFNARRVGLENVSINSLLMMYIDLLRPNNYIGTETRILPSTNIEYNVERFYLNSRKIFDNNAKVVRISTLKGAVSPINPIKNFMRDYHKAYDSGFKGDKAKGERDESYFLKIDPRNALDKPIILNQEVNYDTNNCQIEKLEGQTLISTNNYKVKFLDIEPSNLMINECNAPEFRIQRYHTGYDPRLPLLTENGQLQSNIHIDYIEIEIDKSKLVFASPKGNTLYNAAKEELRSRDHGVVFNLGFFIVIDNISNILTNHLNIIPADYAKPIGFFLHEDSRINGTLIQIPMAYQRYFAAMTIYKNSIEMERYDEFLDRHETEDVLELLMVGYEGEVSFIPIMNRKIKMIKGRPIIKSGKQYKYATTTGPISIWDRKLEFTTELMLTKQFIFNRDEFRLASPNFVRQALIASNNRKKADFIRYRLNFQPKDGTKYRVVDSAIDSMMFTTSDGSGSFIYGQRSASRVNNLSMVGIKNNMLYYFLAEGRGFSSLGIDKSQFAKIVYSFDLEKAVFCDNGFSANAVIKSKGDLKTLVEDPEGRRLSSVCIVKEKMIS